MDPLNNINVDKDKPYLYWWVHSFLFVLFVCSAPSALKVVMGA